MPDDALAIRRLFNHLLNSNVTRQTTDRRPRRRLSSSRDHHFVDTSKRMSERDPSRVDLGVGSVRSGWLAKICNLIRTEFENIAFR